MRVQEVIKELRGEKIDIIRYSENPAEYVANALSPADVVSIEVDEEKKMCSVKVPESQLSLAIGREGQNVRLAARLTGWKIDLKAMPDHEVAAMKNEGRGEEEIEVPEEGGMDGIAGEVEE